MSASGEIQILVNDDNTIDNHIDSKFDLNANVTSSLFSNALIPKVGEKVRKTANYEKYYVPKVVSIGPYHFGKSKLQLVEKLKPFFAMKLLSNNKETLRSLYNKLGKEEMVQHLRSFYEEGSTIGFSDMEFTHMMVLDSCFILYYARYIFGNKPEDSWELKRHEIVFVHQDLFLLENQIPYIVLIEVMNLMGDRFLYEFKRFIDGTILAPVKPKRTWLKSILNCLRNDGKPLSRMGSTRFEESPPDHLLNFLHRNLTKCSRFSMNDYYYYYHHPRNNYRCTFRNVRELVDVGIRFKPSDAMSLAYINFTNDWWGFSAAVELPKISVGDSTKHVLLNLLACETSLRSKDAWVTSYACFLRSLIEDPEDVKVLRKFGVLENTLVSDKEVAELFNEICTDLAPDDLAYMEAKHKMQRHFESWKDTAVSQLNHVCVNNPCAFFSLFGVISLFLSAIQTYFTVWSPKGECDDLCMFLKKNHHL